MRRSKNTLIFNEIPIVKRIEYEIDWHKTRYGVNPKTIYMRWNAFKDYARICGDRIDKIDEKAVYFYLDIKVKYLPKDK